MADFNQVFLNIPFDPAYRKLQLALICGVVCSGRRPRSAAEIEATGLLRMDKIMKLITTCGYSIHDLSRMCGGETRLPRFNMPFELGIAFALAREQPRAYYWFLLEKERYRLARTLSDLAGCDPKIHGNLPERVIRIVTDWFRGITLKHKLPTPRKVFTVYESLLKEIPRLKRKEMGYPSFNVLVYTAARIAKEDNVLPRHY